MVRFVICDDCENICENNSKVIKKVMKKTNDSYIIMKFSDYDKEIIKIAKEDDDNTIFILDIELPTLDGIDIARRIRKYNKNSIIILLTAHYEMGFEAFKMRLLIYDFLVKTNEYEKELQTCLTDLLRLLGRDSILTINYSRSTYEIKMPDINYIIRDQVERKTIIKTIKNKEFETKDGINNVFKNLNKNFVFTHRSCIINLKQLKSFDYDNNVLYFKNGQSTDYISRKHRKELKKYVI